MENYESTPSFHISGKIGGKIADEFEVDLSVNETLQVLMKLGKIVKKEISWQNLYDKLNNRKMKVDHPLLKAINKSKRRSLCLISMVVTSGSEMNLDEDKDVGGQGKTFNKSIALAIKLPFLKVSCNPITINTSTSVYHYLISILFL